MLRCVMFAGIYMSFLKKTFGSFSQASIKITSPGYLIKSISSKTAMRTSKIIQWTVVKYPNGKEGTGCSGEVVNIPCFMHDTCLCQIGV